MKLIATIPYEKVKFRFISDHYDLHLKGTCIYNGSLCQFRTLVGKYDEDIDDQEDDFCEIYSLTFIEKIRWVIRQKKFELMVGYHWTVKKTKSRQSRTFYYRKPKWLYKKLFKLYYKR